MVPAVDGLNEQEIRSRIQTKWAAGEVVFLEETDSTNAEAWKLALEGYSHGSLVVTNSQRKGRGRRGRSWYMSDGTSIAMSMILKPPMEAEYASMVTLVQAIATSRAIEEVCGIKTQIKWPNDILIKERKVCGILTEMNLDKTSVSFIIIGTGINVNQESFPEEIAEIAIKQDKRAYQFLSKDLKQDEEIKTLLE